MTAPSVSRARPSEFASACRALFAPMSPEVVEIRAARAVQMIADGDIDPSGLLVARARGRIVGAVLVQFHPGRAAVVSPPGAVDERVAELLAKSAVSCLRDNGMAQAQSVVAPTEKDRARPLERLGFRPITQLIFLCRSTAVETDDEEPGPLKLTEVTRPEPEFAAVLAATYEETLDCPELDGTRSIEDVIAGYQATARGPLDWVMASTADGPVGVVIQTAGPQLAIRELSYIGLVRTARGQGLGRLLLRSAIRRAKERGAEWLTLSVDERNEPAVRLYRAQNFREFDRQIVFFWTPP